MDAPGYAEEDLLAAVRANLVFRKTEALTIGSGPDCALCQDRKPHGKCIGCDSEESQVTGLVGCAGIRRKCASQV